MAVLGLYLPGPCELVWILVLGVPLVIAGWRICAKAGYHGALGLLLLVPVANFVLILYLGFATWPVQRELESLRASQPPSAGQQ